jgi:sialate O-acetylesterase
MKSKILSFLVSAIALSAATPAAGDELLVNGNFEKGVPEENVSAFVSEGWRRLLWKPDLIKSWLTDSKHDPAVGKDNNALKFLWDGTSICQYFSAEAGQPYAFSLSTYNPGMPDSRWQPRIQVQWFDADNKPVGGIVTVAETDNASSPPKQWNPLAGNATAPAGTVYGRLLLNLNNRGSGQMWVAAYLDNASVQGRPGSHNLPVSFISSPYPLTLPAIPESTPYKDSLTKYADDKDGDKLTFAKISGPAWLAVGPDGTLTGTPAFQDAGNNEFVIKVSDGRGSTDTQTLTIPVLGHLRLANLFDDNMVLQRECPQKIWGYAVPNSPVLVQMSTGEHAETTSDADGAWSVTLPAMKPSLNGPVTLTVKSGDRALALKNLLVGDVWLCSGQSNMAFALDGVEDSAAAIAAADHPNVRLLSNPDTFSPTPWTELPVRARWEVCTPATAKPFSAVAYYFGQKINAITGIPIGLISANKGGTKVEQWSGGGLYNSRIHPYTRLPIKGVIWYQGEANISDGAAYTDKLCKMVADWRATWGEGEFPFYFVQIAPFAYEKAPMKLPELWEAQTKAMERIPNSGMAVINDIGNTENIHPKNKAPVGERLARWALNKTYGHPEIVSSGPVVRAVTAEGQRLRVRFDHTDGGLVSRDGKPLSWFEVAGADEAYVGAEAIIDGDAVLVSSPSVPTPAWVRFAWGNIAAPNLMNKEGLPANAFRMRAGALPK